MSLTLLEIMQVASEGYGEDLQRHYDLATGEPLRTDGGYFDELPYDQAGVTIPSGDTLAALIVSELKDLSLHSGDAPPREIIVELIRGMESARRQLQDVIHALERWQEEDYSEAESDDDPQG